MERKILEKISAVINRPGVMYACAFARERHGSQSRLNGELHIEHVLRVALAAAEYASAREFSPEDEYSLVVSAVLHDVLEDTPTTDKEIAALFGNEVTQIDRSLSHVEEEEPDEVHLGRVAAAGLIAVLVKRFDRLDNLRSLRGAPADFRARKLVEVRAALPLWSVMDPESAVAIEQALIEEESYEPPA